jgi:chorismate mutase / prephenate dehydratase
MKKLPTLAELRRRIDRIDGQLHELLQQRAEIVHIVRQVKGPQSIFIRPGREASMVRDLVKRPAGRIPAGLVMRLWREMIGAFTLQEGRLTVAVSCEARGGDLWDIARDFYGALTPLIACKNTQQAFAKLKTGDAELAVLPLPKQGEVKPWWGELAKYPALNIFVRMPFDALESRRNNGRGQRSGAVTVARLQPEVTGEDYGLLLVWGYKPSALARIKRNLQKLLKPVELITDKGGRVMLITVRGLLAAEDPIFSKLRDTLAKDAAQCRRVGGYAVPMNL